MPLPTLLSFIEHSSECTAIEELWSHLCETVENYGFPRVNFGMTTQFAIDEGFRDLDDILLLSNYPKKYREPYIQKRMFLNAPMVRWAAFNVGALSWRWLEENRENFSPDEQAFLEFNEEWGVTAGYTLSFRIGAGGKKGGMGLAAAPETSQDEVDEIWQQHGRVIHAMCEVFCLKAFTMPFGKRALDLTARQRDVLRRVGEGQSIKAIAAELGVSIQTIDKHLRLAREVLNVDSTTQAVLKAAIQNQIYVLPRN